MLPLLTHLLCLLCSAAPTCWPALSLWLRARAGLCVRSYEIFQMSDEVLLLARGVVRYAGPTSRIGDFFAARGIKVPSVGNPADFFMVSHAALCCSAAAAVL
jgi:hypothetical protein